MGLGFLENFFLKLWSITSRQQNRLNNSGNAILTVLGATAILVGISLSILQYSKTYYGMIASSTDRIVLNGQQNIVQSVFKNLSICTCNLQSVSLNPLSPMSKTSINALRAGCSHNSEVIFQKSGQVAKPQDVGDIFITDISQSPSFSSNEFNIKLYVSSQINGVKRDGLRAEPISLIVHTTPVYSGQVHPGQGHRGGVINRTILGCGREPASAPSNLVSVVNPGVVKLSWGAAHSNLNLSYQVLMAPSPQALASGVTVCNTSDLYCDVRDLLVGAQYCFAVQSVTSFGVGLMSQTSCVNL